MIAIRNTVTGAVESVDDAGAYASSADWVIVADPSPPPPLIWDEENEVVLTDLAFWRAAQRAIIQRARDAAMMDNVVVPDMPTEGESAEFQLRASTRGGPSGYDFIMGFFTRAQDAVRAELAFTRPFKLADNRWLPFDGPQWVAIGDAIETQLQARFERGEVLLGRIDAAETLEAIAAVIWTLEDEV